MNVVDVDASAILRDLHEKPEADVDARLDVSLPATQAHLRTRMGNSIILSPQLRKLHAQINKIPVLLETGFSLKNP